MVNTTLYSKKLRAQYSSKCFHFNLIVISFDRNAFAPIHFMYPLSVLKP